METIRFTCPYCGTTITLPKTLEGKQGKCSSCGKPVVVVANNEAEIPELKDVSSEAESVETPHTTVELTGKKFKLLQLVSILISVIGIVLLFVSVEEKSENGLSWFEFNFVSYLGFGLVGIGLISFLATKFRAWWHHG